MKVFYILIILSTLFFFSCGTDEKSDKYVICQTTFTGTCFYANSYVIKGNCVFTDKEETICGNYSIHKNNGRLLNR